ncbi:GHKL domain-containing protein [Clostridium sp.]|uniref:sensor histidine kinase n=1 Tax=Clostridium sp. TaxID=1506 RepID=UPI0026127C42|nr:GHKL domain-containing protein [Clostridium sp.]
MKIFLVMSIFIIGILYGCEIFKRKRIEKQYDILDKKYMKVLANNMDMSRKVDNLERDFEKQINMANEIRQLQQKSRLLKHDMKNHIMVIASFFANNEHEKAKEYLSKILDNLNKMYTYVSIGNSLLNNIINTKLQYAKEKGIDIKAEIENLSFEQIGSVDFSALLNNLLDNAIEGSMNTKQKELDIRILRKRGYDTILVKNSINNSILNTNPKLISTKENKEEHGNGLKQIKSIVEKYDGMIDIYEEDNYFCVYVVCPH